MIARYLAEKGGPEASSKQDEITTSLSNGLSCSLDVFSYHFFFPTERISMHAFFFFSFFFLFVSNHDEIITMCRTNYNGDFRMLGSEQGGRQSEGKAYSYSYEQGKIDQY